MLEVVIVAQTHQFQPSDCSFPAVYFYFHLKMFSLKLPLGSMLKSYISGLLSEVRNKMVFLHMYQNRFPCTQRTGPAVATNSS